MPDFSTIVVVLLIIGVVAAFASSAIGAGSPDDEVLEKAGDLLGSGEAKLVDVRTPREYAANGLEGAENIPLQQLSARIDEVGPRDEAVHR